MRQTLSVAGSLSVLLAAGLLSGCSSPEDQALTEATSLARDAVDRMRTKIDGAFSSTKNVLRAYADARKSVAPTNVQYPEVLIGSKLSDRTAWFDVTVVENGEGTDGFYKADIAVRLCARLTAYLMSNPIKVEESDLTCPSGLPSVIPGSETIEKIVHLHD